MSATQQTSMPPGPKGALIQTIRYFRDPYGYYERMQARFGNLFTMPTMNGTLVVALDSNGARDILVGGEDDFVAGFGFDAIEPMIGRGSLLLTSGDRHQRDRKILSPTFTGARMRSYGDDVIEAAEREIDNWQEGSAFTLRESMSTISIDVILRSVFGVQDLERAKTFRKAIYEAVVEVSPLVLFFKFLQLELGGFGPWSRFLRRMKTLDRLIEEQIESARNSNREGQDVLSRMLASHHEDGSPLSDKDVRDQLVTILMAGHETTGTSLSWALYELIRNPEALQCVRDEIRDLGPAPQAAKISKLPFLSAVCQETLRMHPVLPEFFRTVRDQYEIQGFRIPAGVTLAGGIIMIHRDADLYPEPDAFKPERFLERKFAPHEMATFGGGHRYCLGAAFALNEMKLVLARVVSQVELELTVDRPLKTVRRNGTLAPELDVPVRITKRLGPVPA